MTRNPIDDRRGYAAAAVASVVSGLAVARGAFWAPLIAVAGAGFFGLGGPERLGLIGALIVFPFSFGDVGGVPSLLVWEVLALPLAISVFAATPSRRRWNDRSGLAVVAVLLFIAAGVWHALRVQMGTGGGLGLRLGSSGLRPLWHIMSGGALFFFARRMMSVTELNSEHVRKSLLAFCAVAVILSFLRIAALVQGVETPLVDGTYDYTTTHRLAGGIMAGRVGGLAESVGLGLAAAIGAHSIRRLRRTGWIALACWAIGCTIVSAGRTFAVGLALAVGLYALVAEPGARRSVLVALCLVVGATAMLGVTGVVPGITHQVARLRSFEGGISGQDPLRGEVNRWLWASFVSHPVLGKGIGAPVEGVWDQFVAEQLLAGGHSGYLSLLGNFGVLGAVFVLAVVWVPLVWAIIRLKLRYWREPVQGIALFVVFGLFVRAVEMVAGGNGYSDPWIWVAGGALWGLLSRESADA